MIIDIIIPVYNVELYLKQCIDSVINQACKDYRLLLVDDGSTDNSGLICDEYAANFEFVEAIHQVNQGLSAARNVGLLWSKSEYIMFIDSDDWIAPNMLENLLSIALDENADMVCCSPFFEYDNFSKVFNGDGKISSYNVKESFRNFFLRNSIGTAAWGKLYKRKLFENIFYPPNKIHEDLAIIKDLLLKCKIVVYVNLPLYHYRQQNGSLSRTIYSERNYSLFEYVEKLSDVLLIFPDLKKEYEGYYYIKLKDLLTLFKTKEVQLLYADDFLFFKQKIRKGLMKIMLNKTISIKDKLLIVFAGTIYLRFFKVLYNKFQK